VGQAGRLTNSFVTELREDPRSPLVVARRAALGGGGDDAEMFGLWMLAGFLGSAGDPRDERRAEVRRSVVECVMKAHEAGLLRAATEIAVEPFRDFSPPDLCARLARFVDPDVHWDAAVLLYRQGLVLEPGHASLNNSYGYRLLERDESIERAEAMIERAVRADPKEPAYLDSLGWARYKRGILLDQPRVGPLGEPTEGAITLLERALELLGPIEGLDDDDPDSMIVLFNKPTILDHAGDAHWAAGNRDLAMERWTAAGRRAADAAAWMERQNIGALMETAWLTREIERINASTAEKLEAARSGEAVPIARIHGTVPDGDGVPVMPGAGGREEGPGG